MNTVYDEYEAAQRDLVRGSTMLPSLI